MIEATACYTRTREVLQLQLLSATLLDQQFRA